jgi:uncharacterized protein (TIGR02001 family)
MLRTVVDRFLAKSLLPLVAGVALCAAAPARPAAPSDEFSFGGSLALTSDYIYRGLSESDGHGALQADLHVDSADGTFLGVWGSTRTHALEPDADYDLEVYLGHRFRLSNTWSATLDARSHYFVAGRQDLSADYQELAASVSYMDRWTASVTAIPNAVRYYYYYRTYRSAAWVADTSGQWLLGHGFFVTAGAGYYHQSSGGGIPGAGYAYGNAGLAFEYRSWRLDMGYFVAQQQAQQLVPYPIANDRFAASLLWRF